MVKKSYNLGEGHQELSVPVLQHSVNLKLFQCFFLEAFRI